jgi:antitoxin (DNA-binding transcriptional repressor) of toxin-antitoxin stability system
MSESDNYSLSKVEDARSVLGTLAKQAHAQGKITILTIHGFPVAKIAPLSPEEVTRALQLMQPDK